MQRKKCPKCGYFTLHIKNLEYRLKCECTNCGFKMQIPTFKICVDGPRDTIIDKMNSEFIQERRRKDKNGY